MFILRQDLTFFYIHETTTLNLQKGSIDLTKFSEIQIAELKQAFLLFDKVNNEKKLNFFSQILIDLFLKDGNGDISLYEIGSVFRSLGLFPTENELNEMLKEIDIDGDGNFTFDEFVQLMFNMGNLSERSEEQEEMELRQAFRVFDKAGNGYITSSDLRSVLQCLGEQLTEDEIEDMINEVDIDGDGRIDYDEFVASLKAERESSCITINEED